MTFPNGNPLPGPHRRQLYLKYGYAVFPGIGKGAIGIGGAHGKGTVFEGGKPIGSATMTQVTIGLQLGGQAYSEVIFFGDEENFKLFTSGRFEFAARASAVAVTAGASADLAYSDGVAIVTMTKGGLMYEASLGGQKFSFKPVKDEPGKADSIKQSGNE